MTPPPITGPGPLAAVHVTPKSVGVAAGASMRLSASGADASGRVVSGVAVSWSSLEPAVAAVASDGTVSGRASGQARIVASAGSYADTATISVTGSIVASVVVSPHQLNLRLGTTGQLSVVVRDVSGAAIAAPQVAWSSSAPAVVSVSNGIITGQGDGVAQVIATSNGVSDTSTVTVGQTATTGPVTAVMVVPSPVVVQAGRTVALAVTTSDASGAVVSGRPVTWTTENGSIAVVGAGGVLTGVSVGVTRVVAQVDGVSDTVPVTVTSAPVASVSVSVKSATLTTGGTLQLSATARDAQGNTLTNRVVGWSSTTPTVVAVSSTGGLSALQAGAAKIIATVEGRSDTAIVTVTAPVVASISVTPTSSSMAVNGTQVLTAIARDISGKEIVGAAVTWISTKTSVATVANGTVTGKTAGTATITASSGGKSASATVTVTASAPVAASITVTPSPLVLTVGGSQQLTAVVKDGAGAVMSGATVTWSSSNGAAAAVTTGGYVTAIGAGQTTVTATSGSRSTTLLVTVTAPVSGSLNANNTDVGTIGQQGGDSYQLPGVLVVGDDDASDFAPLQSFITYDLATLPAGAVIQSAILDVSMDSAGVFGNPFALGSLYVERATALVLNTNSVDASSILVTASFNGTTNTDVTALVEAARSAGATSITFRLRFAQARNNDGNTDQLELAAGQLHLSYTH